MDSFFKHDKKLIEALQVLMTLLKQLDSIYDFWKISILSGYSLEKIVNSDKLSIRIIPKKRKRIERMFLLVVSEDGQAIKILDINKHVYKAK